MKWVRINKAHFNADLIKAFYWAAGRLYVYWLDGGDDFEAFTDPDRENYKRLCSYLTLSPVEEDGNGKE